MTLGCPNFNPGAFLPSATTVGCVILSTLSPLMPLLWLTRSTSSSRRLICRPIFCRYARLDNPLLIPKSFGFRNVPSVRHPLPSLKYCFRSKFLYSICRLGCTPSWITRVRKRPGVFLVTTRSKINLHPVGPPQIQVVPDDLFKELPSAQGPVEDLGQTNLHLPDR